MRRSLCVAVTAVLVATAAVVAGGSAGAATSITAPATNPFVVPGNAAGLPQAFTVTAAGFAPNSAVFVEQCDGVAATTPGWTATGNCDLGSSPSPAISDGAGVATFPASNVNLAFTPFKGASPQGIFNCLSPNDAPPANGLADFRNCQLRVSSNNAAGTGDQVFIRLTLPDDPNNPPPPPDLPDLGIGNASVLEGSTGTRAIGLTVSISEASLTDVTAHYRTVNDTAKASDFTAKSGTVTIPAGALSAKITVSVKGDTAVEGNEKFSVKLSSPVGATITRATARATILDDDPSTGRRLGIGAASVLEGNAGSRTLVFTVSLSDVSTKNVKVSFATVAGTATDGSDFVATTGRLKIKAGKTVGTISVDITGDTTVEPDEAFTVHLSGATGATLSSANGVGSILNDD